MKKIFILLILFSLTVFAGDYNITDEQLTFLWNNYPNLRSKLEEYYPDKFMTFDVDSVLINGWREITVGDRIILVQIQNGDIKSIVDMEKKDTGYIDTIVDGSDCLIIGRSVNGSVPSHIQDAIDVYENQ